MDLGTSSLIASAAGSLANVAGNVAVGAGNLYAQREANKFSEKMYYQQLADNRANYQMQLADNIRLWNMQNDYNSPSSQIQRLTAAGLNPHLVYGNGVTGNSSSSPSSASGISPATAAKHQAYQLPQNMLGGLSSFLDQLYKYAQIKKTNQETANLNETQKLTSSQIVGNNLKNAYQQLVNSKTELGKKFWLKEIENNIRLQESQIDNFDAKTANTIADTVLYDYRRAQIESQIQESLSRISLNNSHIKLNNATIGKISHEILNLDARTAGQRLENQISEILINNGIDLRSGGYKGLVHDFANQLRKNKYFIKGKSLLKYGLDHLFGF